MVRPCDQCGATTDAPKRCSRCKRVVYCSRECQTAHWPLHKSSCSDVAATAAIASLATVELRHGKTRRPILVPSNASYGDLAAAASSLLRVPLSRLKLIYRGRLLDAASDAAVSAAVAAGGPLLAVGEPEEDSAGLDPRDIELLTQQLKLSRDEAVRALRRQNGDVIDALRNS